MKWSPLAIGSLVSTALLGAASAQGDYPPSAADASTYSSNPGSTAANTGLTAPRTGIYDAVTAFNAAADNSVNDYILRPTLINGQQFFSAWGGNTLRDGAFSFNASGYDWFGSAEGTDAPSRIRAGLAKGGAWSAGLMVALAKASYDSPTGDSKVVLESDGFGLFGNYDLGNSDVYAALNVFTGFGDLATGDDDYRKVGDIESKNTEFGIMAGWKKDAAGQGTHALNAEIFFDYSTNKEDGPPATEASLTSIDLNLLHGYILKETPAYDVFLGSTSTLTIEMEEHDGAAADPSRYGLSISPNLAFQKNLMWGFEGFAGAAFTLGWQMTDDATLALPGQTVPAGANETVLWFTSNAGANLGLRWVKDNLAIEGALSNTFLSSGPNFIGGGTPGFLSRVGLSLAI